MNKIIFLLLTTLTLSSCNLFGGIDKPSGDIQLLDAARACLDQGDFVCAQEYYQKISNGSYDAKMSEGSLVMLAENNIFFMSDLISSLGSGIGGASSLIALAQTFRSRDKTDSTTFTIIQRTYGRTLWISEPTLKAYYRFISSLAMMSAVLAGPVGPDGVLTASDLAATPSTCKGLNAATCAASATCNDAASGYFPDGNEVITMDDTYWLGNTSTKKFRAAAAAADAASSDLGISSGIFGAIASISAVTGANNQEEARCTRMYLLQTLFPD